MFIIYKTAPMSLKKDGSDHTPIFATSASFISITYIVVMYIYIHVS